MQVRTGISQAQASRQPVASILGNDVHLGPASHRFGRHAARLDNNFVESLGVEAEDTQRLLVLVQTFHVRAEVRPALAVNPKLTTFALVATDILEGRIRVCSSRDNRGVLAEPLGGGDCIQRVARNRGLRSHVLDIDDRGLSQYRDCLFERSRRHLGIDCRRERRRQLDTFPLERSKTGQRERDSVGTGPQINNAV